MLHRPAVTGKARLRVVHQWCVLTMLVAVSSHAYADIVLGRLGSVISPIAKPSTVAVGEGIDTYLKKVNAAGGVNGQKISVVFRDDEFKPDKSLAAAQALIEQDRVVAIVAPQGTQGPLAIIKDGVLKRNNVAVIGPFTGTAEVLKGENFFPTRITYDEEFSAMTRHMKRMAQSTVAYLYYNTAAGPAYAEPFARIAKEEGVTPVASVAYDIIAGDAAKQTDAIRAAVKKVIATKPAAVFLFAVGPTMPEVMKELKMQGELGLARYTFSINSWESLIKNAGLDVAKGVVFSQSAPYPYSMTRKVVTQYLADLKKYSPEAAPGFASFEGYVIGRVTVEALRRVGSNPTPAKVLRALENFGRYDMGDFAVEYSAKNKRVDFNLDITMINGSGKLVR